MKKPIKGIFAFLAVLFLGEQLNASCCSMAATSGVGRLLRYERAYLEYASSARFAFGAYDNRARLSLGLPAHLSYLQLTQEMRAMMRVSDYFLPFVKIPALTSISRVKTRSSLGSVNLGARVPLLAEGLYGYAPALSLISLVQLPSEELPCFLSQALILDKSIKNINLSLSYTLSLELGYFSAQAFKRGIKQQLSLSAACALFESANLNMSSAFAYESPHKYKNQERARSARYQLSISSTFAWAFHSHLTLNAGLGALVAGKNSPSEIFAHLGLRAGIF